MRSAAKASAIPSTKIGGNGWIWRLKPIDPADREQEERRRIEKAAALKVLAESRIALLVGPAGTGKTTLLSVLCGHPAITSGEVLFLAPTGKARVRMEQAAKDKGLPIQG